MSDGAPRPYARFQQFSHAQTALQLHVAAGHDDDISLLVKTTNDKRKCRKKEKTKKNKHQNTSHTLKLTITKKMK